MVAFPLPVAHPQLPMVSSAVITVGLPIEQQGYEGDSEIWADVVGEIANEWAFRLYKSVYSDDEA